MPRIFEMIGRLLLGLLKGIIVGGLLGFILAKVGMVAPGPVPHYLIGAGAGVLIGLIAGKPIWAKDAKIEAGMKAFIGAGIGALLMLAIRNWLVHVPFPVAIPGLTAANASLHETASTMPNGSIGGLALTSFAIVAGVLGAFYDADNTPSTDDKSKPNTDTKGGDKKRVDVAKEAALDLDDLDDVPNEKRAKK